MNRANGCGVCQQTSAVCGLLPLHSYKLCSTTGMPRSRQIMSATLRPEMTTSSMPGREVVPEPTR